MNTSFKTASVPPTFGTDPDYYYPKFQYENNDPDPEKKYRTNSSKLREVLLDLGMNAVSAGIMGSGFAGITGQFTGQGYQTSPAALGGSVAAYATTATLMKHILRNIGIRNKLINSTISGATGGAVLTPIKNHILNYEPGSDKSSTKGILANILGGSLIGLGTGIYDVAFSGKQNYDW
jgi:hypothetical protein